MKTQRSAGPNHRTEELPSAAIVLAMSLLAVQLQAQSEFVPLHSWWSTGRLDTITTSEAGWIGAPGETRSPDYSFHRAEGLVFNPSLPPPPTTVPLYRWFSPLYEDNFLTSDPAWAGGPGDTRSPDYRFSRLEGYAFDRPLAGTVPLNGWWNGLADDNRQTTDPSWPTPSAVPSGLYSFVRTEGYVLPLLHQPPFDPRFFGNGSMRFGGQAASGSRPLLVIMNQFSDSPFLPGFDTNRFRRLFFGPQERTVAGYYEWNSYSKFRWTEAAVISVAMTNDASTPMWDESTLAFWTSGITNTAELDKRILAQAARAGFNFAPYDVNGDGIVPNWELGVIIIQSTSGGGGQTRGAYPVALNGKRVDQYLSVFGQTAPFDLICHELAHQLGQIDIYGNPTLNCSYGLAAADCGGTYYHMDPWHKMRLGWVRPWVFPINSPGDCVYLDAPQRLPFPLETVNSRPIILFDPGRQSTNFREYFLLEYRTRTAGTSNSYDADVTSQGLVIWAVATDQDANLLTVDKILAGDDGLLETTPAPGSDDIGVDWSWPADGRTDAILPGRDFVLQTRPRADSDDNLGNRIIGVNGLDTAPAPGSDDMRVDTDENGTFDEIRAGADGILQTTPAPNPNPLNQDVRGIQLLDKMLKVVGKPVTTNMWGRGNAWTPGDVVNLRYYDGSDSGIRLRVGPITNNGNTISVEWNMDTIPPRLDAVASPTPTCGSTGTVVTLDGAFGVSQQSRRVSIRDGLSLYDLVVSNWTCDRIIARIPAGVPSGNYRLTCYGDEAYSIVGNWLPFRVTPAARLEAAYSAGSFRVRVVGDAACRYVLQRSTDLRAWTPVHTNSGTFSYFEPAGISGSRRFYRTVEGP